MVLALGFIFCSLIAENDWNPEDIVTKVVIVGEVNSVDRELVVKLEKAILGQLHFWKQRGLNRPPDLEGIYYISNFKGMSWIELLQILNPKIPNIREHIASQYEHLKKSKLGELLRQFKGKDKNPDALLNLFFDFYARFRYGMKCKNFFDAVENNISAEKAVHRSRGENYDNAFYGRFPLIDLTELLPDPGSSKELFTTMDMHKIINQQVSRRVILLPRISQKSGDAEVSTAADLSIALHEMGHVIVDGEDKDFQTDRLVNEVFADWLAAEATDNPKIGSHFVSSGTTIRDRILREHSNEAWAFLMAREYERLAAIGYLRNMEDVSTLSLLPRDRYLADDYEGGNPLRWLLWKIARDPRVDKNIFEAVSIRSILKYANDPVAIPDSAHLVILFRSLLTKFLDFILRSKLEKDPQFIRESNTDNETILSGLAAMKVEREKLETEENASKKRQGAFSKRRVIKSDIVIPQFLRALYTEAHQEDPKLAEVVRQYAEMVTENRSRRVSLGDGLYTLVFDRNWLDQMNLISRWRSRGLAKKLHRLETQWHTFAERDQLQSEDAKEIRRRYALALDQLTQYERTSSFWHLYFPHPWLFVTKTVATIGVKGLMVAGKLVRPKKSCAKEITNLKV